MGTALGHCANIVECTYTILGGMPSYTHRLYMTITAFWYTTDNNVNMQCITKHIQRIGGTGVSEVTQSRETQGSLKYT
jgi:hypothetical protein